MRVLLRLRPWLIAFALVYALYLLIGNVFLNTPISRHFVNHEVERFHASWNVAITLWPGDLMVWDLQLGGHTHTHLWSAHGDFAHGRIALLPLLHREFRMHALEATQVDIERDETSADLASKPYSKDAWTFRFDRISSASLRKLRVNRLTLDGNGEVAFGFVKQVHGGPWQLFPSQAHMREARMAFGSIELAHDARVDLDAAIASHTREQAAGIRVLNLADASLRVEGATSGVWMRTDPKGGRVWSNANGAGRFSASLNVSRGVLRTGSHAHWDGPLRISDERAQLQHDGRVLIDLEAAATAITLHALAPPVAHGAGSLSADLRLEGNRIPISGWKETATRVSGAIDVDWRFTSLRWLAQALARAPWLRLDGAGEIIAVLRLQQGHLAAGSHAEIPVLALQADVLNDVIEGDGHAQGRLLDSPRGPLPDLRIDLDHFRIAQRSPNGATFVRGRALRLELSSDSALSEFAKEFHANARFADADVPDLVFYNRYLPGRSLRFLAGSGKLASDLAFDADGHVLDDHTRLATHGAHFALAGAQFSGELGIDAHLSKPGHRRHHFILDGTTIALRDVLLEDADATNPTPRWAHIAIDRGVVDWLHPLRMDAHMRLDMQDIRMLMTLFAKRRDLPKWVLRLIDEGEVHAEGDVRLVGHELILDRVVARNDRFELQARLHAADGHTDGDLYLRWKLFGIGVELHDGKRKLHLAGAREWFASIPHLLPEPHDAP